MKCEERGREMKGTQQMLNIRPMLLCIYKAGKIQSSACERN